MSENSNKILKHFNTFIFPNLDYFHVIPFLESLGPIRSKRFLLQPSAGAKKEGCVTPSNSEVSKKVFILISSFFPSLKTQDIKAFHVIFF